MKPYYIIITPFFPSDTSFRGPFIYDQVKAIERTGKYEVIVFKPKTILNKQDSYEYKGIRVHLFPMIQMPSYLFNGIANGLNSILFLHEIKKLRIDINNISIAHGHTSIFGFYALTLKKINSTIKTIVQHHDRDPFTILNGYLAHWKLNCRFRANISIKIFNQVDYHVSISKVVEDNLLSFPKPGKYEIYKPYLEILQLTKGLPSIHPQRSLILYNGVDTSIFFPKNYKHKNSELKIGCIGNFQMLKGQIVLIKAVERIIKSRSIENISVTFIGSGELLQTCKDYVQNNGLTQYIKFKNEIIHDELVEFYNSIDLFVLPTFYEGFGCVFTEAAACGIPFMICKHQGAAEYIPQKEEDKWLFSPNNDEELATLIYKYYKNRYKQILCHSYDINILIKDFLKEINE